ncbi:MAG: hypothetical protein GY875_22985 [Gammaproteobacteria bacterium]|nr:hypothetical protein [Gammaproteobacteria bacterium]
MNNHTSIRLDYLKQALLSFVDLSYLKVAPYDVSTSGVFANKLDEARSEFCEYLADNYPQEWDIRQSLRWTLNLKKHDRKDVDEYLEVPWPNNNDVAVREFLESLWDSTFRSWKYRDVAEGAFREEYLNEWMENLAGEAIEYLHSLSDKVVIPNSLEDIPLHRLALCLNELDKSLTQLGSDEGAKMENTAVSTFLTWVNDHPRDAGPVYRALRWILNQSDFVASTVLERMNTVSPVEESSFSGQTLLSCWGKAFENWQTDDFILSNIKITPPDMDKKIKSTKSRIWRKLV